MLQLCNVHGGLRRADDISHVMSYLHRRDWPVMEDLLSIVLREVFYIYERPLMDSNSALRSGQNNAFELIDNQDACDIGRNRP